MSLKFEGPWGDDVSAKTGNELVAKLEELAEKDENAVLSAARCRSMYNEEKEAVVLTYGHSARALIAAVRRRTHYAAAPATPQENVTGIAA